MLGRGLASDDVHDDNLFKSRAESDGEGGEVAENLLEDEEVGGRASMETATASQSSVTFGKHMNLLLRGSSCLLIIAATWSLVSASWSFLLLTLATLAFFLRVSSLGNLSQLLVHKGLTSRFLVAFLLARFGDWLQGPYFYAVYAEKRLPGLDPNLVVMVLFLTGFGSGLVFSAVAGGVIDVWGRKKSAVLCLLSFVIGAVTVFSNNVVILVLGRICGGVAATLLFSAFDAWLASATRMEITDAKSVELYLEQINSLRVRRKDDEEPCRLL